MSKGLSIYQKAVVELMKEKGALNILDVSAFVVALRSKLRDKEDIGFWRYGSVEEIDEAFVSRIYRMMRSLEKRGLVARLLHRRPAVWYYVEWEGGKPWFPSIEKIGACFDYNVVKERRKEAEFTTKGETWVIE